MEVEDRSYYFGKISRSTAVELLQNKGYDGSFLLRQSTTQDGVYTISIMQGQAVRHVRVLNTQDGGFVFTRGDRPTESVWELVMSQMDKKLTNTENDHDVASLMFPMNCEEKVIAPDLLMEAEEEGILDAADFDPKVADFLQGGMKAQEIARSRSLKYGHNKPTADLMREQLGNQGDDPDLERFMNGAITADELQMRRAEAVMKGQAEMMVVPKGQKASNSNMTVFDDGFNADEVDQYR